jgi:hypothetical protein
MRLRWLLSLVPLAFPAPLHAQPVSASVQMVLQLE